MERHFDARITSFQLFEPRRGEEQQGGEARKSINQRGRMRNVEQGRDGYLYIGVENPGMVFRLKPTVSK